jgi:CO/xanthine dehydrogenase Mo-binding subunit
VINAVENAIGVRISEMPASPPKILKALESKKRPLAAE